MDKMVISFSLKKVLISIANIFTIFLTLTFGSSAIASFIYLCLKLGMGEMLSAAFWLAIMFAEILIAIVMYHLSNFLMLKH